MDQQTIISEIENRAKAIGLSTSELCRRASVHPTTFSRWKQSERNPAPIGATIRSLSLLEEALANAEAQMGQGEAA